MYLESRMCTSGVWYYIVVLVELNANHSAIISEISPITNSLPVVGPASYVLVEPRIEFTIGGLIFHAMGAAAVTTSSYSSCLFATINLEGYSHSVSTHSVVSGSKMEMGFSGIF